MVFYFFTSSSNSIRYFLWAYASGLEENLVFAASIFFFFFFLGLRDIQACVILSCSFSSCIHSFILTLVHLSIHSFQVLPLQKRMNSPRIPSVLGPYLSNDNSDVTLDRLTWVWTVWWTRFISFQVLSLPPCGYGFQDNGFM